jgi:endo-1,4-beta-xylanase
MSLCSRLIPVLALLLCACQKEGPAVCTDENISLYKAASFDVGVAVNVPLLDQNPAYRNTVIRQFNVIKPAESYLLYKIHPEPDRYDFSEFDYLVDFCRQYNKHLQGSNLLYQLYLPDWVTNFKGNKADWEVLAKNHIQTVVGRYKGIVESWMVVNEALNEDGTLQQNIWLEHIGSSYIEKFFKWAHEADPDALLFYNDFNLESNTVKLKAALDLTDMLRNHGAQVDGLGLQLHINDIYPTVNEINQAASLTASHDLKVYYSEWDISLNTQGNKAQLTPGMMDRQKRIVKEIVEGFRELPARHRYGISFWNVGDSDSWIRTQFHRIDWPLLFDEHYVKKPAYCGFMEALEYQ